MKLRWLSLVLWSVAAGVAVWLLDASLRSEIDVSPTAGMSAAGQSPAAEAVAPVLARLEDFPETLRRPLLAKTRKPFVPQVALPEPEPEPQPEPQPEVVAAVETPPPDGLTLRGIAITSENRSVLLITANNPAGQWIAVGGSIESWTIAEIAPGYTVLRSGQRAHKLHLYVENHKTE